MEKKKTNDKNQIKAEDANVFTSFVKMIAGKNLAGKKICHYIEQHEKIPHRLWILVCAICGTLFLQLLEKKETRHIWKKLKAAFGRELDWLIPIISPSEAKEKQVKILKINELLTGLVNWQINGVIEENMLSTLVQEINSVLDTGYTTNYLIKEAKELLEDAREECNGKKEENKPDLTKFSNNKKRKKHFKNRK